jgi:hypothetical protein
VEGVALVQALDDARVFCILSQTMQANAESISCRVAITIGPESVRPREGSPFANNVTHMRYLLAVVVLALGGAPASTTSDTPAPLRSLVYAFTFEMSEQGDVTSEPGSTGARTYSGAINDKGTISVDVLREAPDRGLLVVIREAGADTRKAPPATCAVYGNTDVVCDPSKTINLEEFTLLRFLGVTFVDPSKIDAKQHWPVSVSKGATSVTADYTINANNNGVMAIAEQRHVQNKSQGIVTSDFQTKIDYDTARLVPTAIEEYVTEQRHAGMNGESTTIYQTTLKLTSDSMATK